MKRQIGLTVVLLGLGLAGCSTGENKRADKVGETFVGQSFARAKDSVCMDNLRQIRQAIAVYKTTSDDENPPDLKALRLPAEMLADPIGKEPYTYDPQAGTVKCVHAGHGKY